MIGERYSEITIETLPPLRVARFRAVSLTPEEDAAKVLAQWAAGAGIQETPRNFGFDVEVPAEQAALGRRGYELWYVIPDGVAAAGPVTLHDFPGGRFAALTIRDPFVDPFATIPAGWGLLHEWVITHGRDDPGATLGLEEVIEVDGRQDMILYHEVRT
jgi:hypothetical protein